MRLAQRLNRIMRSWLANLQVTPEASKVKAELRGMELHKVQSPKPKCAKLVQLGAIWCNLVQHAEIRKECDKWDRWQKDGGRKM